MPLAPAFTGSSSPAPTYAVTTGPLPFNHGLHLVLTVCPCGLWLLFWILLALGHASKRKKSVTSFR